MSEQDTREKLEADVHSVIFQWGWDSDWSRNEQRNNERVAMLWLDRQAAITRRETRQSWQDAPNILDRTNLQTIADLQAKLDELTEQLKAADSVDDDRKERIAELQAKLKIDAIAFEELRRQRDELTAERDLWLKRYQQAHKYALELIVEKICRIVAHVTDGLMTGFPKRLFEFSCGHSVMLVGLVEEPNYCSICGAKVVRR